MTPWEETLAQSGLDGETNKCASVTEAIEAAGWKARDWYSQPGEHGVIYPTEEGRRRLLLPLEVQRNVHWFKKGTGEAGREATAEINRQLREYLANGRPEPARTGLPRIIMAKALNSERLTPARLMSEQELRVWRTTDPKATAKYNAAKHVGVVLLCWKGKHVPCLAALKHCCRVTEADLRAMLERWMEHHGSKPVPAGLWPPGFKLGDDQLHRSFPSALGWALGYAALGTQALVHLTDPITNEGVLPFSAQELSNPWSVDGSEGPSLGSLRRDLPGLEEQLVTEWMHDSQPSTTFKTVAVGLWYLKQQGLFLLPRLPEPARRRSPQVTSTPRTRPATGEGAEGGGGAKRYKPTPTPPRQQQPPQPSQPSQPPQPSQQQPRPSPPPQQQPQQLHTDVQEEAKASQEDSKPPSNQPLPTAPGPRAMQGLVSGIKTLLGKLAQVLGQDVTTVSPPLQGALAFLTTLERKGLVASESDLQYGDTIVTPATGGAVEQLLQPLRVAQDTAKARKAAVVTLLRQHKEVHKQCFPAQLLTLDKLVTGLEALKKQLQDAIAKRDQAQRDIQAQAVAVSEAQALVIASPVLQAEVRQVIAKLQSQCAVLTDKLHPHDSSVARLQAAHDALAPAIQQWKSAWDECAAVRAQVNAAALETLHTQLQQHWANLRQALTT